MSSLSSVGFLERKFVSESAGNPNEQKLRYNDPGFITFRVLFDFEPPVSSDEVMQGLLLNESRDESAVSYLRRMGELERADVLNEFIWMLNRTTNDFPWFFKSIQGMDGLWKWGHQNKDNSTDYEPVTITIECYETVDLRMTALADLYRKATRDRRFFRELLTVDKKRFNMTILIGEARNLRTFANENNGEWLNHVSTVAFRCLDCEFDFSDTIPGNLDGTAAPAEISPKFSIKVHRVQETNSYSLLNYMLGELKRDLIIKQGGSGADLNQRNEVINYRPLLSPFMRSYEGNYEQVINDLSRLEQQSFIKSLTLVPGDRIASLPYVQRDQITKQQLNGISKQQSITTDANSILAGIRSVANIEDSPSLIGFGRPSVETELTENINMTPDSQSSDIAGNISLSADVQNGEGIKIEEEMATEKIDFIKPKVEDKLSEITLNPPPVEKKLADVVDLSKPTVNSESEGSIEFVRPTINTEPSENVDLSKPTVATVSEQTVPFTRPTVENIINQSVNMEKPSVETSLGSISFGTPSVITKVDNDIQFVRPVVIDDITENINFEKPKVEDGFKP
jgi:hypothetical protein